MTIAENENNGTNQETNMAAYVPKIMELKAQAEAAMKVFMDTVKELGVMGFKCAANADGTTYIYRDTRESYGEVKQPPRMPPQGNNALNS